MGIFDKTIRAFGQLTQMAPVRLDSITNAVTGLGTTEDSGMYGEPTLGRRLDEIQLHKLYVMSDLAQRIVDEVVDDALRQGYTARPGEDEDSDTKSLRDGEIPEPDGLSISEAISDALKEARHLGGAGIMIQTKGTKDYSQPFVKGTKTEVTGLLVLDRTELTVCKRDYDAMSPTFGQPLSYTLSPRGAIGTTDSGYVHGMEVHRSHLLIFRGQRLPRSLRYNNDDWGDSVLQASWDRIRNFEQTELAMGNIVQRFEIATYSIDGLGEVLETPEGKSKILERLKLIQKTVSMVRAVVLDKQAGESYERSFTSVNGLDTIWDRLAHSVAKSARQSMTQLFGAAPSGLATDDESGRANWRKQIRSLQTTQILPALETYYERVHGGPVVITFMALDEATASEEANIKKLTADTRKLYIEMGAAIPLEFRPMMRREGLVTMSDEELEEEMEEMSLGDPDAMAPEGTDPAAGPAGDPNAPDAGGAEEDLEFEDEDPATDGEPDDEE